MEINLDRYRNLSRHLGREYINLNPIQRGGVLPVEAKKAIYEFWDGYSICDYCGGRLDEIKTPPVCEFLEDLSKFLDMDISRPTHGARESKFIVMHSICREGDYVVLDENAHYTSYLAIERGKLNYATVKNDGYPTYRIEPEKYKEVIDNFEDDGKSIGLVL
ncbi:MAG TPA: O-phospho-L-seryl-tRNA:Cys-tRNA synthase, partial [Methanococcaceae archaeon]|nr:O-phospho-L-seryl-tRNA:Cys-tRNA synthase [Methanococcaceae archaeon]